MPRHANVLRLEAAPAGGLLSLEAAAAYLGISPGTLKHWVHWRKIEYVKIGKFTKFRQQALDRFVNAQTVAAVDDQ